MDRTKFVKEWKPECQAKMNAVVLVKCPSVITNYQGTGAQLPIK